jgi:hypothetical protein
LVVVDDVLLVDLNAINYRTHKMKERYKRSDILVEVLLLVLDTVFAIESTYKQFMHNFYRTYCEESVIVVIMSEIFNFFFK